VDHFALVAARHQHSFPRWRRAYPRRRRTLVPQVMGSRSTYTGGVASDGAPPGRQAEWRIAWISESGCVSPRGIETKIQHGGHVEGVAGPQDDYFDTGPNVFFDSVFTSLPKPIAWVTDLRPIEPKDGVSEYHLRTQPFRSGPDSHGRPTNHSSG
jgi:hypothetical protein